MTGSLARGFADYSAESNEVYTLLGENCLM